MIDTILFDLDGTLLPLEQEAFVVDYFNELRKYFQKLGLNQDQILKAVIYGTKSMLNNDGREKNEIVFAKNFSLISKHDYKTLENFFLNFYDNYFERLKIHTTLHPLAQEIVSILKEKGYMIVLATNPVFPKIATSKRIAWAGLNPEDFELITTFENSSYCKPNLNYYFEILNKLGKKPSQVMMIGNDIEEDMIVQELNIKTYLLIDKLINPNNKNINQYRYGDFSDLFKFITKLPNVNK